MSKSNAPGDGRRPNGAFAMVENDINRDPTLPQNVKTVYGILCGYANADREAWPGQDRIAWEGSLSIRAVGNAIRDGSACGVWSVRHTQTSNVYRLHDREPSREGDPPRYVVGTGPRTLPASLPDGPVGKRCRLGKHVVPTGNAGGADEIDQRPRPVSDTRDTSSDAACGALAAGQARPSQGPDVFIPKPREIRLDLPDDFDHLTDGKTVQQLMRCSFGALRAIGLDMDDAGRDRLKRSLVRTLDETGDARDTAARLKKTLERAQDPDDEWACIVVPLQPKAS